MMQAETSLRSTVPSRTFTAHATVLLYVAAIVAIEFLVVVGWRGASELISVALLAAMLNHYGLAGESARRVLPALTLLPLLQILNSTLPSALFPAGLSYLLVSLPLLVAAVAALYARGETLSAINLTSTFSLPQLLVAISGIPLGILFFYGVSLPSGQAEPLLLLGWWSIPLLFFAAAAEEFVFRGVLQHALQEATGRMAVIYVAAVYTLLGSGALLAAGILSAQAGLSLLSLLLAALFLGLCRARGASLFGLVLAHGLLLTTWLIIWPLVVA